jgi:hypothetical protein
LSVPACSEATGLLLRLEQRGILVGPAGNDLLVSPPGQLTADERADLQRLKPWVRHLVDYRAPEVH